MNRSESKYFATAAKMDDAFMGLLEKKDFAYITVKEICAAAGVNRSTFYLHYQNLGDLLDESVERMNRQFMSYMGKDTAAMVSQLKTCPEEELYLITPEYLVPYLSYVKDHQRLFTTVVARAGTLNLDALYRRMFEYVFVPILDRYGVSQADRHYLMAFFMSGLMAIIAEWLKGGCMEPVEQVTALIERCVARPLNR